MKAQSKAGMFKFMWGASDIKRVVAGQHKAETKSTDADADTHI